MYFLILLFYVIMLIHPPGCHMQ